MKADIVQNKSLDTVRNSPRFRQSFFDQSREEQRVSSHSLVNQHEKKFGSSVDYLNFKKDFSSSQVASIHVIDQKLKSQAQKANAYKERVHKDYEKNFNKWRDVDLLVCLCAMIQLSIAIMNYEFSLASSQKFIKKRDDIKDLKVQTLTSWRQLQYQASFMPAVVNIVTIGGIVALYVRHKMKTDWENIDLPIVMRQQSIQGISELAPIHSRIMRFRSPFRASFWLEAFILLIGPIPYWDPIITISALGFDKMKRITVEYLLSDFILAFMFIKMIFLIRAVFNYSMYTDTYAKKLCNNYGVSANIRFSFKCQMINHPMRTIIFTFFSSVLILAYCLRIFEAPYYFAIKQIDFENYFNSIWCVFISVTTVGFGDEVPFTVFGRILLMASCLWGNFMISLMIVSVTNVFSLQTNEQKAMAHLLQTRQAAASITSAMRYFLLKQKLAKMTAVDDRYEDKDQDENMLANSGGSAQSAEQEYMIVDRVELSDIYKAKREMLLTLSNFKQRCSQLKFLNIENEMIQQQNTTHIKYEVIELADRFDVMQQEQRGQSQLLWAMFESLQGQTSDPQENNNLTKSKKTIYNHEDVIPELISEEDMEEQLDYHTSINSDSDDNDENVQKEILQTQLKLSKLQNKIGKKSRTLIELEENQPSSRSIRHSPFYQRDIVKFRKQSSVFKRRADVIKSQEFTSVLPTRMQNSSSSKMAINKTKSQITQNVSDNATFLNQFGSKSSDEIVKIGESGELFSRQRTHSQTEIIEPQFGNQTENENQ